MHRYTMTVRYCNGRRGVHCLFARSVSAAFWELARLVAELSPGTFYTLSTLEQAEC